MRSVRPLCHLDMWITGTTAGHRAPVLRRPGEVGLQYEDMFFPSMDGVPIDGWFIPADSDKLVIQNHFLPGNRYGYPGQLPEFGGLGGFEVNFLPEFRALHDAGYNILCQDIRNFGLSGTGNGDTVGIGLLEYRDVIGSVRHARSRPDTKDMTTVLLSVCLGADSTCVAMARHPEEFEDIPSLILLQPVSGSYVIEEFVKANDIPTLVAQVHHDSMTRPEDVQSIYDAVPADRGDAPALRRLQLLWRAPRSGDRAVRLAPRLTTTPRTRKAAASRRLPFRTP
ncbi:alpha/beta hydrolase family protein [Streptomyces sp. NRRL F-2799]|uniref:alpha/beta hydrolase family protein n=1 Tax=Streptomyces sp. NRRL F-2799 TaxID=1463844 RepID=UPI0018FEE500|nr:hypothetical protein [Streptomyces sp. NRRL F-2799]